MTDLVLINGQIISSSEARLDAVSSACLYGTGVFTTVAIAEYQPLFWEKHWRRLVANAARLDIDISKFDEGSTAEKLAELIGKKQVKRGRARITFSDESPSEAWSDGGERKTSLSIITGRRREVVKKFKLTASPYPINTASPLVGMKSSNYLEYLMALEEAKARRFNEAIRLNELSEVTSACMANFFWLKGGRLYTPSLQTGCLPGTTREFVIENLECDEVEAGIEALHEADEIFLTSAGIGVVQVAEFDGRKLRCGDHQITRILPF